MNNISKSIVTEGISRIIMSCYRLLTSAKPDDGPIIRDVYAAALRGIQDYLSTFNIELIEKDKEIFDFLMEFHEELVNEHYDLLPVNSLYINYLSRIREITVSNCLSSLIELLTKVTPADSNMVSGILKAALAGVDDQNLHDKEECVMYTYLENVQRILLSGNNNILPCRMNGTSVVSLSLNHQDPSTNEVTWHDLYNVISHMGKGEIHLSSEGCKIIIEGVIIKVITSDPRQVFHMEFECIRADDGKSYDPIMLRVFPYRPDSADYVNGNILREGMILDIDESIRSTAARLETYLGEKIVNDLEGLITNSN